MRLPHATVAATTTRPLALAGRLLAWRCAFAAVAFIALAAGIVAGLGTLAGGSTTSAGLQPLLQAANGPLIVYSEFASEGDTLWAAGPNDPAQRSQIAFVEHASGYAIFPSLSPDGRYVAYTMLPRTGTAGQAAPAEVWLLDVASGERKRLAGGLDLRGTPLWSPASDAVVVRQANWPEAAEGTFRLLRVSLDGQASELASGTGAGLFAIGFSPDDGALYYASITSTGSDLLRVAATAGAPETVAHLSDGITRDWHLSPDGSHLAYLTTSPEYGFIAEVLDLEAGERAAALQSSDGPQFNPIWDPDGALTIGQLAAPLRVAIDDSTAAGLADIAGAAKGFDVPLSWSPAGDKLTVREFAGDSMADPGPSRVVVTGIDGTRNALSPNADVVIAGWLEPTSIP